MNSQELIIDAQKEPNHNMKESDETQEKTAREEEGVREKQQNNQEMFNKMAVAHAHR